jgi:hypothetical protein
LGWADSIVDWTGTHNDAGESADEVTKKLIAEAQAMQDARKAAEDATGAVKKLGETEVEINVSVDESLESFFGEIDKINKTKVEVGLSTEKFKKEMDTLGEYYTESILDLKPVDISVKFDPNEDSEKAQEYIADISEKIKGLELKLKTDEAEGNIKAFREYIENVDTAVKELSKEKVELQILLQENLATGEGYGIQKRIEEVTESINQLNNEKAEVSVGFNETEYVKTQREIDKLVTEKHLTILADEDSVAHAKGFIAEKLGDHTVITNIFPPSKENVKKTKEELEKIVPPEKQLQIMADIEIAQIESETKKFDSIQETIQKGFEFKSKLDIANVEANVKILEKSMENISEMFAVSGAVISDAFGLLSGLDFGSAGAIDIFRLVKDQIKEQNELQREALELQKEITQSQIKLNEAKQKALLAGKPMFEISIDGSGLQYHLETLMYSVLEFTQAKATAEGVESLLGIS